MVDMAEDVRVLVFFSCFLLLFHTFEAHVEDDTPLADLMGVLGGFGNLAGTGENCKYQCSNGELNQREGSLGCGQFVYTKV